MLPAEMPSVQIQISGPTIDPAALTTEFGVQPSIHRTLDASPGSQSGHRGNGIWIIDTQAHVAGYRLVDHRAWLQSRLAPHQSRLQALGREGLAHLYVRGAPESWDFGGYATSELRLGLPLEFVVLRKGPSAIRVGEVRYVDK